MAAYEGSAGYYGEARRAYQPERAAAFAAALDALGPFGAPGERDAGGAPAVVRLDLGSGPGHYLPHLGRPVVAADPAVAMLVEARRRHPGTLAAACEVEALPLRHGAVAGVWASKSLQHVPAGRLPAALGEVHRVLPVGGLLDLTVFDAGGAPGTTVVTGPDDDIPGRLFASWDAGAIGHLLTGAGFTVDELATVPGDPWGKVVARARRARTLADTVGPGMRVLACGLNPSVYSADAGVGFARPGNRFWPAALAAGLASAPRDPAGALRDHGLGMTDVVKRATVAAAELTRDEYRAGLDRVRWLVSWLRPRAVCFVGLAGWRAAVDRRATAGVQPEGLGGVPVYVMPSTSGLNASSRLDDLVGHLRAAADLAGDFAPGR